MINSPEQRKGLGHRLFGHRGRGKDRLVKHGATLVTDGKDLVGGTLKLALRGVRNTLGTLAVTELATAGSYEYFTHAGINPLWTLAPEAAALLLTGTVASWSVVRVIGHAEASSARAMAHGAETTAQGIEALIDEVLHHGGKAINKGAEARQRRKASRGK